MTAYLHLTIEDSLYDGYEKLMIECGKTVEQGIREFLATLLLPTEAETKAMQSRLANNLPLPDEFQEMVQHTYPKKDC